MTPPPRRPAADAPADWVRHAERSNLLALRVMAWIALRLGRGTARLVLHPITLYYLLLAPRVRRHSARYLARALGRPARWADLYRHLHTFAATVLDRVYFVRGRLDMFDIAQSGGEAVDAARAAGPGAVLLGAHLGSFEALHAFGASRPGLRVAMVMYPANARMLHAVLHALAPDFPLGIIPIGQPGSTLAIRGWVDAGGLVGLLGDRLPPANAAPSARSGTVTLPFLGRPATFGDGPLRVAQLLRREVIFMVALYRGGRRYELRFAPLADFRTPAPDAAARERQLGDALRAYVVQLEALCREAPYNWFNFYDFWQEDKTR